MRKLDRTVFQSIFSDEICNYLDEKIYLGFKENSYFYQLKEFDQYCTEVKLDVPVFSQKDAIAWGRQSIGEGDRSYCNRISVTKNFLIYLSRKDYDVAIIHNTHFKSSDFKPHIYSDDEITRYFKAIDSYRSNKARMNAIQFPVLFRLFYCCGTRLNETLCIRLKDVNLSEGT